MDHKSTGYIVDDVSDGRKTESGFLLSRGAIVDAYDHGQVASRRLQTYSTSLPSTCSTRADPDFPVGSL